jgi:hypothetical protein
VTKAKMRKSATPERILQVKLVRGTILCCWGRKNLIYTFYVLCGAVAVLVGGAAYKYKFCKHKIWRKLILYTHTEPDFVNLLRSPRIDPQPGRPVLQP